MEVIGGQTRRAARENDRRGFGAGGVSNSFEEHGEVEVVRKGEIAVHGMLMGTIQ